MSSYWQAWRASHPEYRRRESERSRRRRLAGARGDRTSEYARQRERRAEQRARARGDNGWAVTDHPILDTAKAVASQAVHQDRRSKVYTATWEDAVGIAALALVRGKDPRAAVDAFVRSENAWAYRTAPLYDALLAEGA